MQAPEDKPVEADSDGRDGPSSPLDDETLALLISRYGRGDDTALGELVEREGARILRRIEGRIPQGLKRRIGASDLVQQTMVELLGARDRFENRGVAAFRKMLSTMADLSLAQAIRRARAKKRDIIREHAPPPQFADESGLGDPIDRVAAEQTTPSRALSREETAEAMRRSFHELPEADREIIRLIDYEEVDYEEVAERLGITVKTTQKRHSRAIARLRELVRKRAD